MSVRKQADPTRADVLRGDRSRFEGEWVPMGSAASPDPITGDPRPAVVGLCAVCEMPVLEDQAPVSVEFEPFYDGQKPSQGTIHGSFDCLDQPQCPERRGGVSAGGEWAVHCMLPTNHPGDCYWGETA